MAGSHKLTMSVDVSDLDLSGVGQVEVDLHIPPGIGPSPVLWCCVPGGGVTRSYFDPEAPVEAGQYSMARFAAERSMVVLLIDPPGAGGSDVPDDGYQLTPQRVAGVLEAVVTRVIDRFASGQVPGLASTTFAAVVGVGHSAGALLVACQQAHHRTFDALMLLGFSDTGLIGVLNEDEKAFVDRPAELVAALPRLVQARFGGPLPQRPYVDLDAPTSSDAEAVVKAVGLPTATRLLALVGLMAIIPGSMKPEMDLISVPTFAAVGERDIAGDVGNLVGQLPACHDLTLITLSGVGHNHNQSGSRLALWDRMIRWSDSITPPLLAANLAARDA
jgi:pimeloyl-ACP methyl ester carboxylesterase